MAKGKIEGEKKQATESDALDVLVAVLVNKELASLTCEFGRVCKLHGIDSKIASVIALRSLKRVVDETLARKEAELEEKA